MVRRRFTFPGHKQGDRATAGVHKELDDDEDTSELPVLVQLHYSPPINPASTKLFTEEDCEGRATIGTQTWWVLRR